MNELEELTIHKDGIYRWAIFTLHETVDRLRLVSEKTVFIEVAHGSAEIRGVSLSSKKEWQILGEVLVYAWDWSAGKEEIKVSRSMETGNNGENEGSNNKKIPFI